MPGLSEPIMRWFREHHHVATTQQLHHLGLTSNQRRALVRDRILVYVHRTVLRLSAVAPTLESDALAACLTSTDVIVSGPTAGRLWGLRRLPGGDVHIAVPHGANPIAHGVVTHRSNRIEAADVVRRKDGIRLTSPPRTLFDLADVLSDLDLESVIEQALDRGIVTTPQLAAVGRRLAGKGRPGSARFVRVLSTRPAWQRPAGSHLEVRVYDALRACGVAGLVRQHALRLPDGRIVHLDCAVPDVRWGVEVDHVTWHGGRIDAQRDKARDRASHRIGWQIERVTDDEVEHRLTEVAAELFDLYQRRSREVGRA